MEGKLVWKGRMLFEGETDVTGKTVLIDAHPHHGGQGVAATPMEHLLLAVAGCTALDVVAILRKMKQELREYWVEIHAERHPEHPPTLHKGGADSPLQRREPGPSGAGESGQTLG
ncbi:MAG: hypothetical protein KatS3mg021_0133 [Fimbriimonadales bacterium]|nr:MAG: hypothetical protein KatS3mg021_0133 [Fimbriimonadales bacterium]